jgi:hypothetical protein
LRFFWRVCSFDQWSILCCGFSAADSLPQNLPAEVCSRINGCLAAEQAEQRRARFCREAPSYDEAGARGERKVKKRTVANPFLGGFQIDFYVEVFLDGIFNRPACLLRGSGCGGYGFFSLRSSRTSSA